MSLPLARAGVGFASTGQARKPIPLADLLRRAAARKERLAVITKSSVSWFTRTKSEQVSGMVEALPGVRKTDSRSTGRSYVLMNVEYNQALAGLEDLRY